MSQNLYQKVKENRNLRSKAQTFESLKNFQVNRGELKK